MANHNATICIEASAQQVFEAITKPELVKLWQYGKVITTDWKPGNEIRFSVGFEGKTLLQWGTVLEVRTNELIKYNLFTPKHNLEDKPENYCTTTYNLTGDNRSTRVVLIQEDNRANNFTAIDLKPILSALKKTVEALTGK